jgi:hypothetical protein
MRILSAKTVAANIQDRTSPEERIVMDSKSASRKANLKQYRAVNGKWQFVPVVKIDGKPKPQLVLIDGKSETWKGGGKFYLEWYEDGRRKTKIAGSSPREALDAWQLQTGILSGKTEATEEPAEETGDTVVTIDAVIEKYLREVKAAKSKATLSVYSRDLCWFRKHCSKVFHGTNFITCASSVLPTFMRPSGRLNPESIANEHQAIPIVDTIKQL